MCSVYEYSWKAKHIAINLSRFIDIDDKLYTLYIHMSRLE